MSTAATLALFARLLVSLGVVIGLMWFAARVVRRRGIRKIRMEEARLQETFGAEYDAYRRETWGLVPGVRYSGWNDRTTTGT